MAQNSLATYRDEYTETRVRLTTMLREWAAATDSDAPAAPGALDFVLPNRDAHVLQAMVCRRDRTVPFVWGYPRDMYAEHAALYLGGPTDGLTLRAVLHKVMAQFTLHAAALLAEWTVIRDAVWQDMTKLPAPVNPGGVTYQAITARVMIGGVSIAFKETALLDPGEALTNAAPLSGRLLRMWQYETANGTVACMVHERDELDGVLAAMGATAAQ